ncbi:MAG: HAD-IC family P-type ATPase [Bacilli bacterium]|nr:HAD-IC family P-type ATPase [Bacilli bacterium]
MKRIISDNFFTLFNFLNFGIAAAIFMVGKYENMLFIGTVIFNIIISTVQEIRAKRIVDKLSLISQSKVVVIRDGKHTEINREGMVLDDVVELSVGMQVVADSIVMSGTCLVNESFITGEQTPIEKKAGDMVLSGSFITGGKVRAKVEHVKDDNYTSIISKDAKYVKKLNSVLMNSLNKIIKYISFAIVPVGIMLFVNQYYIAGNDFNEAVLYTTAALIGMIPDGLILLTSTVLAVSIIRLSEYKVLVQELYCIETLARVDVLCLDKTGTITEGVMEVVDFIPNIKYSQEEAERILDGLCHTLEDVSPTMNAVRNRFETKKGKALDYIKIDPFSSDKKYSKVYLEGINYYLGAPEFIIKNSDYSNYSKDYRTLLLAGEKDDKKFPIALILIQDKIRKEAKETLEYFKKQGVEIKIISGDNPITISQIAKRVGIEEYDKYVDLSTIKTKKELKEAYLNNTIFGRVKPDQKKELILLIKSLGHTVAMTGDGVNDVLALKEADCSIAMASGSDAARNVSQLVLMESNFDAMPKVVEEGRRCINNIGRSASLFLTKTIYTGLLVIMTLFTAFHYPYLPIHLSLMNLITIGAPSLILALEPNKERVKGNFLVKIIANAAPTALTVFSTLFIFLLITKDSSLTTTESSTVCVIMTTIIMLIYQYKLCKPFNTIRRLLMITMCLIFSVELLFFRDFFTLADLDTGMFILITILIIIAVLLWNLYNKLFYYLQHSNRRFKKMMQ